MFGVVQSAHLPHLPAGAPNDLWSQILDSLRALGRDPTSLSIRAGLSVAVLLVALVGGRWLARLAGRAPEHLESTLARSGRLRRRSKEDGATSVGPWLSRLTAASVWLAALLALAAIWFSALGGEPDVTPGQLDQFFKDLAAHVGGSLLVLAATLGVARLLQRSLERDLAHRVHPNLALLAGRVIYVAILAIGFVIILTIWNTGIVLPVTLIGALTVALSLALQDVLKNLVSGVYLLLERPFSIGDRITLAPYTGVIEDIEIRYTSLRTADGQRVIIPNSMLFSSAVVNLSAYENRRAGFTVTIPDRGRETIERAEQNIRAALDAAPDVLKSPPPEVAMLRAAGGTVDLRVDYWLPTDNAESRAVVFALVLDRVRSQVEGAEVSVLDAAAAAV
jgi:small-conductance mechanosensitive channel